MGLLSIKKFRHVCRFLVLAAVCSCAAWGLEIGDYHLGLTDAELLLKVEDLVAAPLPLTQKGSDVSYFKKNPNGSTIIYYSFDGKVAALQSIESNKESEPSAVENRVSLYIDLLSRRASFDGSITTLRSNDLELYESTALRWVHPSDGLHYLLIANSFETSLTIYDPDEVDVFDIVRSPDARSELSQSFGAFKKRIANEIILEAKPANPDHKDYLNSIAQNIGQVEGKDVNAITDLTGSIESSSPVEVASNDLIPVEAKDARHNVLQEGLSFLLTLFLFSSVSLVCLVAAFLKNKKVTLLLFFVILALGYGLVFYFFRPGKITITRVDEHHSFASKQLPLVSSLGVSIYGEIDGDAVVRFSRNPEERGLVFELEGGSIDLNQGSDWYADSCFIFYEPRGAKVGKIFIEYTLGTPFN